jgi:hypothetical protein
MIDKIINAYRRLSSISERLTRVQEALGRIEQRQTTALPIEESEFRVFSQWGEDGIIQQLVRRVPIKRRIFVEFGVENYIEANTRFLITNDQWSGLVMDGNRENIEYIKRDPIYWASNLKADCQFIDISNINQLLIANGISGDIGLLSIDIDGNDFWVWKSIEAVSPRIVICEYSSQFGPIAEVTTPYNPSFIRSQAHHSQVYYGASITALTALAATKGYSLVAGNRAGNNIFFVRNDLLGDLRIITPNQAYRRSQFREARDENGQLTFEDFWARLSKIGDLPLHDLSTGRIAKVRDLIKPNDGTDTQ